ncbi:MAG: DUF59 domain-containing protein [Magnetococcales bacterium]|nr:DUF59 domain-containing protein [Magnetococcales bacterium]
MDTLREKVIAALRTVLDPEFPINIFDLGLVYRLEILPLGLVSVQMTLTAPACPVAQAIPEEVAEVVGRVPGVNGVDVELVWDPPWSRERMNEEARWRMEML